MKVIADLHIHSKYARACSPDLDPANLALWAKKKGISILGTGDFTHPGWFNELSENLVEEKSGLYKLKNSGIETLFLCSTELALIYKQGEKVRRVHVLVFAPSLEVVAQINFALSARGINLKSDGRPIMGLHASELLKILKDIDQRIEVVPAHAWTPHFGVFGSLSGFDSLDEAFGEESKYIFAIETGLSSDPEMNWKVPMLDNLTLISNSDAHSLRKLGREANVFEISPSALSYDQIIQILKNKNPQKFIETIEFFPEEGKYHLDGHADCKFSCEPSETKRLGGICPVCKKKLLRGVMSRVADLASLSFPRAGAVPEASRETIQRIPFRSIIPLEEIIAETYGVGPASKKVQAKYFELTDQFSEFDILLDLSQNELINIADSQITESILRVRTGKVHIVGGYDGVFGKIQIYSLKE